MSNFLDLTVSAVSAPPVKRGRPKLSATPPKKSILRNVAATTSANHTVVSGALNADLSTSNATINHTVVSSALNALIDTPLPKAPAKRTQQRSQSG